MSPVLRMLALAGTILGASAPAASFAGLTPQAGELAPDFSLADAGGKLHKLADWRGRWLVLYFYPRDDTPGCTTEAASFRDALPAFDKRNAQVVGVSVDDGASHRSFAEKRQLPFVLLSDDDGAVAERYGSLTNLGVMKFAKRHTFLIDPDGRIAKTYLKVDPAVHAAELLADLERLSPR